MRSPIVWLGGKGLFAKNLLGLTEVSHQVYVEVFGGGASLLFAKQPSPVEVYNDLDSGLVNFFRVIRNQETFKEFQRQVELIPYSREEYCYAVNKWEQEADLVQKAVLWFIIARMSFGGRFASSWGFTVLTSAMHMGRAASSYLGAVKNLDQVAARCKMLLVENLNFYKCICNYDTKKTLFYCDPPYMLDTRRGGGYKHEMDKSAHESLVSILLKIKGMVFLSGYETSTYEPLLQSGWKIFKFDVACNVVGRTKLLKLQGKGACDENQRRTECIYINPALMKAKMSLTHLML